MRVGRRQYPASTSTHGAGTAAGVENYAGAVRAGQMRHIQLEEELMLIGDMRGTGFKEAVEGAG